MRNETWTVLVVLFLLGGCAASTDALLDEAIESRDWTAVNERFEAKERRQRRELPNCPPRTRLMCTDGRTRNNCACVDRLRSDEMLRAAGIW